MDSLLDKVNYQELKKYNILICGAGGFIGKNLVSNLKKNNVTFKTLARDQHATNDHDIPFKKLGFYEFDVVINLVGKAHYFGNLNEKAINDFHYLNSIFHLELLKECKKVCKIIHLSSIGVYGKSLSYFPIDESSKLHPQDIYQKTKLVGEDRLIKFAKVHNLQYSILRPALVYGQNAPGNLQKLKNLSRLRIPLPFLNATKKRHMVSIDNLVGLILLCSTSESTNRQIYNVSDDEGFSTKDLIYNYRYKNNLLLFSLPKFIIKSILVMLGRRKIYNQLFEEFNVSNKKIKRDLGIKSIKANSKIFI